MAVLPHQLVNKCEFKDIDMRSYFPQLLTFALFVIGVQQMPAE